MLMLYAAPLCVLIGAFLGAWFALMLRISRHPETRDWQSMGWDRGFYCRIECTCEEIEN